MQILLIRVCVLGMLLLAGCAATTVPELGVTDNGKLAPCPDSPNCVSSDATDSSHRIEALMLGSDPKAAWRALLAYLEHDSGYLIKVQEADYVRAEARTRFLRFVDDVEFHLRPEEGRIAMRSASRVGRWDFGTNRRRLEALRQALKDARVIDNGS